MIKIYEITENGYVLLKECKPSYYEYYKVIQEYHNTVFITVNNFYFSHNKLHIFYHVCTINRYYAVIDL